MTVERQIEEKDLLQNFDRILDEIYQDGVIYIVTFNVGPDFVLGSEQICGRILGLFDPEYGWPEMVDRQKITTITDIAPSYHRHPFIMKNSVCLAVSIGTSEYERIKELK